MTPENIAREVFKSVEVYNDEQGHIARLEKRITEAVAEETERCAKVAEDYGHEVAEWIAAEIRGRDDS